MRKNWSQYSRQRQREHIKQYQPWENSTGPKSPQGKAKSAQNANKGKRPIRVMQKMVSRVHRERLELLRMLESDFHIVIKF